MSTPIVARSYLDASRELSADERLQCFEFISKFSIDPTQPSISLERVGRARSADMWSGRVSRDLRAILHRDGDTWALLYVGHHAAAYAWAERRNVGRHPKTGVLQVVETIETVREVVRTVVRTAEPAPLPTTSRPPLGGWSPDYLHGLGVPADWVPAIRAARDESELLDLAARLPEDVAERLLCLAAGETVDVPQPVLAGLPITAAPDARRAFLVAEGEDELRAALEAPWAQWIGFLHPSQRAIATGSFGGPVLVTGSAGTGKTVVAMHRARQLARAGKRVLLTTFIGTLSQNLEAGLRLFCTPDERQRIKVSTVHSVALGFVRRVERDAQPVNEKDLRDQLERLRANHAVDFAPAFVLSEWENVIRSQGIATWEGYASARRTGRGRALSQRDRKQLWSVFGALLQSLSERHAYDWPFLCVRAHDLLSKGAVTSDFDAVVVDELQDLKSPEIRLLAALAPGGTDALMLVGDAGQRIFPGGFSLRAMGIDVRGRARVLRINYRTTDEIRRASDKLLEGDKPDEDQALPARRGTLSLVRGPEPRCRGFSDESAERAFVLDEIRAAMSRGIRPDEIIAVAKSNRGADTLREHLAKNGIDAVTLAERQLRADAVRVGTMHRAKGLEFRAVFVLGVSETALPDARLLAECSDDVEREELTARERRLLYVAMTRAREELMVTWSGRPSPFLELVLAKERR